MTTPAPAEFSPLTATPEETAAHVEALFRPKNLNHGAKLELVSDITFALKSEGQLQYQVRKAQAWGDDLSGVPLLTTEQEAAWRRFYQAKLDWLRANPGDDLPAEYVAQSVRWAVNGLDRCGELKRALDYVIDVDEWSGHYAPGEAPMAKTPTHEKIASRFSSAVDEVRGYLCDILTVEDAAFLRELHRRQLNWRNKERFWVRRSSVSDFRLVDVELKQRLPSFFSASFERCIREARTLSEVKQLCAIWRTPVVTRKTIAGNVVLSAEKTAAGAHWLMVAPLEARAHYDEISAIQLGRP